MRLIGRECKYSNVLSGPILICRGLDLSETLAEASGSEANGRKVIAAAAMRKSESYKENTKKHTAGSIVSLVSSI